MYGQRVGPGLLVTILTVRSNLVPLGAKNLPKAIFLAGEHAYWTSVLILHYIGWPCFDPLTELVRERPRRVRRRTSERTFVSFPCENF